MNYEIYSVQLLAVEPMTEDIPNDIIIIIWDINLSRGHLGYLPLNNRHLCIKTY